MFFDCVTKFIMNQKNKKKIEKNYFYPLTLFKQFRRFLIFKFPLFHQQIHFVGYGLYSPIEKKKQYNCEFCVCQKVSSVYGIVNISPMPFLHFHPLASPSISSSSSSSSSFYTYFFVYFVIHKLQIHFYQ